MLYFSMLNKKRLERNIYGIESFYDRETQRNLIRCRECGTDLPPSSGSTQLSVSFSFMFCSILLCFLFLFIWLDIWVISQEGSGANTSHEGKRYFKSIMFLLSLSLSESFYYLASVFRFFILVSYSRVFRFIVFMRSKFGQS